MTARKKAALAALAIQVQNAQQELYQMRLAIVALIGDDPPEPLTQVQPEEPCYE